ncbi:MAG TPA: glycosyltransferase [Euzebyales bacterium]|nr:glycosyltransferase [Euzebyales bacterium]
MRVLHVITGLHAGGAEQQLASLLEHTRHDAEVVTMYSPGIVADRLIERGVPVHHLGRPHQLDVRALGDLVGLIRRGRYDVVHTHLYRACLYGRAAARLAGVGTIVATEHSLGDTQIEGRPTTWAVRRLYLATERLGHHTIAVSEAARRRLVSWGVGAERISVIPNGIDVRRYAFDPQARRRERAALGVTGDDVVIGTVGRLHPIKRYDILLDGIAPLLRDGGALLVLVGRGECEQALRGQAARLGIADRTRFLGERGDIPALLSALDIYAAPSAEETFGLAVIEALCAGLPAVVGACPAIDDLQLADVVRCHDASTLSAGLSDLHARVSSGTPPERRAPDVMADRMDIGRVAAAVDNLYQNIRTSYVGSRASTPA